MLVEVERQLLEDDPLQVGCRLDNTGKIRRPTLFQAHDAVETHGARPVREPDVGGLDEDLGQHHRVEIALDFGHVDLSIRADLAGKGPVELGNSDVVVDEAAQSAGGIEAKRPRASVYPALESTLLELKILGGQ